MRLENLLVRNKRAILDDWFGLLVDTYPPDSAQFLKRTGDLFGNPIGASARSGMTALFDELVDGGMDHRTLSDFLDPLIRIRAVQSFSPSQATEFVFRLKDSVYKVLGREISSGQLFSELHAFEKKIDALALIGFDIYMECRQCISQLREKELSNRALLTFGQNGRSDNRPEDPAIQPK